MQTATNLPEWVQSVQAIGPVLTGIATVVIGCAVAIISWRQWRTARKKLALDLFDKRYAWYLKAVAAVEPLLKNMGSVESIAREVSQALDTSEAEGRFLFGDEVFQGDFKLARQAVGRLHYSLFSEDGVYDLSVHHEAINIASSYVQKLRSQLYPYMRMTQKLP